MRKATKGNIVMCSSAPEKKKQLSSQCYSKPNPTLSFSTIPLVLNAISKKTGFPGQISTEACRPALIESMPQDSDPKQIVAQIKRKESMVPSVSRVHRTEL